MKALTCQNIITPLKGNHSHYSVLLDGAPDHALGVAECGQPATGVLFFEGYNEHHDPEDPPIVECLLHCDDCGPEVAHEIRNSNGADWLFGAGLTDITKLV